MRKNAAILLIACSMLAWMLPSAAQAATSAQNQALVQNLSTSLLYKLQAADQKPELSPLVNSTYVLLDALNGALKNSDASAMQAAVEQYAVEMQAFEDTATDAACFAPLILSITNELSAMYQTAAGGGTPVCLFISLSSDIAYILSSTVSYQICILNASGNPDNATLSGLLQQQQGLKIYNFSAAVAQVVLCSQTVGVQDIFNLVMQFITLFVTG
jgi:hypothetical protein